MTTLKIGRAGTLSEANLQQVDIKGGTIRATGNLHLADGSDLTYAAEQFAAYVDSPDETFVPVIWGTGCPPGFDGFYRVQDVALGSTQADVWSLDLTMQRVQGFAAPLFEAVVIGGQRATSPAEQVVARAWHAVPAAAAGYETGTQTPTTYVLQSASGPISLFTTPTGTHFFDSRPQWFLPPDAWYAGAATLRVGGRTVVGRQVRNLPGDWQIDNGLIRATGGPGAVTLQRWDGASWVGAAQWHIARGRGGGVDPLTAPHTLTVIRNDPACVTIRCAYDAAAIIPGSRFAVHVDYSLRRGSTVMDVRLATRGAYQWGFLAPVASGAGSTLAYDSRMDASLQTIACGVSALAQFDRVGGSYFASLVGVQAAAFGWGFAHAHGQQLTAEFYAADQEERVLVVAR